MALNDPATVKDVLLVIGGFELIRLIVAVIITQREHIYIVRDIQAFKKQVVEILKEIVLLLKK